MNPTCPNSWNTGLYLDSLGSALVIAIGAVILLLVTTVSIGEAKTNASRAAPICEPGHAVVADYVDQRPGAPRSAELAVCA